MSLAINIPTGMEREQIKQALVGAEESVKHINENDKQLENRYTKLSHYRQPFLDEARTISQAVIPFLYPPEGVENIFTVQRTNQSMVAKGVINLAKSLASTICPPNARFFTHTIQPNLAAEIEQATAQLNSQQQQPQGGGQQEASAVDPSEVAGVIQGVNNKLMARDNEIRQAMKASPDAENFYQGMVHAEVAGQFCFFKPNLDTSKIYTIENYVSEIDSTGEVTEVIVKDVVHFSKFSPKQLRELFNEDDPEFFEAADMENILVYTRQVRRWDHWEIQVEIAGKRYAPMEGKEDLDAPPFIVVPFFLFPNQKYAVGWCSYNSGDIIQFENMSLSLNELVKLACKVVAMIPPDARVTEEELSKAGMSFVFGSSNPINMIYADISKNLQAVASVYETIRQSLLSIFLLDEAVRRDAERVTQEEIRTISNGLKKLLGGLYLSLARRWQYPYTNRVTRLMEHAGKIPKLDASQVQMVLTAGLETLEQEEDLQNLDQLLGRIGQTFGPQGLSRVNLDELLSRFCNYLSVVEDKLILTEEESQNQAGVSQLVQMAQQIGPQGPQMLAQLAMQFMKQQQGGGGLGGSPQGAQDPGSQPTPYGEATPPLQGGTPQ